jgi:hypothetical protein
MDFPHEAYPVGAKGGAERRQRFTMCVELAERLTAHCRRELAAHPSRSQVEVLQWLDAAMLIEAPEMSLLEQAWCLAQVRERL